MSEVYELCKMLDERGAKWYECGGAVFWETHDGAFRYMAVPHEEALKVRTCCSQRSTVMTAAQAIDATLGRGTCKEVTIDRFFRGCGECGYIWEHMYAVGWQVGPKFCPNCGCEVTRDEQYARDAGR